MKNVDPFIHYCSLINESINEFHGIKPISSGNLDTFTKAFMEAFLMDINEYEKERSKEEREDGLNLHLTDYDLRDMDPRSLKKIIKDCKKFQDDNIEEIEKGGAGLDDPYESAGYDFYFTRNGHGVGFWETDRWEDPYGKQLTSAARKFGSIDGYVGDDNKVYVMGAEKDWTAGGVIQGVSVPKKEKPYKDSYEDDDVNEAVSSEESQQREIKSIVDKCRTITANYIKLLNNRRVSETKLLEYVQTKIKPMIEYMETYLENSTPREKEKFKMFMEELMTSSWLDVDASYWEEEMNKMVGGAVIYGEVGLENLEDLANQGNKDIDKLREGGSKIKEPRAGITSDMSGRWTIKAFDTSKHGKKETPEMKE